MGSRLWSSRLGTWTYCVRGILASPELRETDGGKSAPDGIGPRYESDDNHGVGETVAASFEGRLLHAEV